MTTPAWAIKIGATLILMLLSLNGWFVSRLVTNLDHIGDQVNNLSRQVSVLEYAIKQRSE